MPGNGVPSGSNSTRRARLENIKQREDIKDKLISKYTDKFGSDAALGKLGSATIRNEVNRFFGTCAPVTEANLARLERRLERHAQGKAPTDSDAISEMSISAYTAGSSAGSRQPGSQTARGPRIMSTIQEGSANSAPGVISARGPANGAATGVVGDAAYETPRMGSTAIDTSKAQDAALDWSVLDKLAAQLHKQDAMRQKQQQTELQLRLKADLEKQIADNKVRRERERFDDTKRLAFEEDFTQQWKDNEAAKAKAAHDKIAAERALQLEQIDQNQKRKDEERLKGKQEQAEITKRAEEEIERDRQKAEELLRLRQFQVQDALAQSSQSQKIREENEKKAAEREKKQIDDYRRAKELRDQEAREQTAKEQENRDAIAMVQATRMNNNREKEREIEAIAAAERERKDRQAFEREMAEREQKASKRQETQEYLRKQIAQKQFVKQSEEDLRHRMRASQEADAKNFAASERQRREEKRQQLIAHSKELERQVAARVPSVSGKDCMSECELRMNKQLLEQVSNALATVAATPSVVG